MAQEQKYNPRNEKSIDKFINGSPIKVNTDPESLYVTATFSAIVYVILGIPMWYWSEPFGYISGIALMVIATFMTFFAGELTIGSIVLGGWGAATLLIARLAPIVIHYIGIVGFYLGYLFIEALLSADS